MPNDDPAISEEQGIAAQFHSMTPEQAIAALRSSWGGLDAAEALRRRHEFGRNELATAPRASPLALLAKQFVSPLVLILIAATAISAFLGQLLDAAIIIIIVVLAAVVGFVQEFRSEKAIEALKQMTSPTSTVLRSGIPATVNSADVVQGDIIIVSQGDRVAADARLVDSYNLQVNEASLTGESVPVEKSPALCPASAPVPDRKNIVYSGTAATLGRGRAVVFATGSRTELGKIATSVQAVKRQRTPFEIRMSEVGRLLSLVMLAVVVGITALGLYRGYSFVEMLIWGISAAVAAVPEALPAVIATSLTIGVYKMAQKNAIVRRMPAVETLGAVTFICSDKTGTLTTGRMAARRIYAGGSVIELDALNSEGKENGAVQMLARASALCNDSVIPQGADGREQLPFGDPTEIALASFAFAVTGKTKHATDAEFPRIFEVPFSSERKMMTTVHRVPGRQAALVVTKGAPEAVVAICNGALGPGGRDVLGSQMAGRILQANEEFASEGLRVLAVAYKEARLRDGGYEGGELEQGMNFAGLVGLMDPPREEVVRAISQCRDAGINVTMITGDSKATALSVARELRIAGENDAALTGAELDRIGDEDLGRVVLETRVFARVLPEHKLRITNALQGRGQTVAMTGDGVNDAPALQAADIGVAMGITGTQVAKESASMVLADDNFATIVSAVAEGRRIMDNVKKYLVYLLSANIGEIILFSLSLVIGLPTPLLAKHILYINLATDGSPAIALGAEPAEPDVMSRPPQRRKEGVFSGVQAWLVGVSLLLGITSLALFWQVGSAGGWSEASVQKARTMVFGLVILFELLFAYSSRSFRNSFVAMGARKNRFLLLALLGEGAALFAIMTLPPLQGVFSLVPLQAGEWATVLLLAPSGFVLSEAIKVVQARMRNRDPRPSHAAK